MSPEQREANYRKLERYVFKYTSAWWGASFVSEMTRLSSEGSQSKTLRNISGSVVGNIGQKVKQAVEGVEKLALGDKEAVPEKES
jgi:trehalose 6-phosphate synthase